MAKVRSRTKRSKASVIEDRADAMRKMVVIPNQTVGEREREKGKLKKV